MQSQTQHNAAATGLDIERLENELASMWREHARASEAGAGVEAGAGGGVARVCVVNLIAYSPRGGAERAELDALLAEVADEVPSRAVVLLADRAAQASSLDAYVSTRCQIARRGRTRVCGERVTIESAGSACESLASAVEPLLVPDTPTYLWWKDIPAREDQLFARLVRLADRVVIDSAGFDRPEEDLARVAALFDEEPRAMLSDLNWGRLTTWRNLIAGFWDVSDYRAHLDRLDSVTVEYAPTQSGGETSAQALLVSGWLASRLGWRVVSSEAGSGGRGRVYVARAQEGSVRVELRPAGVSAGPAAGAVLRVKFGRAEGDAEFFARVNEDWTKLETSAKIGASAHVGRVLAYEPRGEGRRLSRELNLLARDRIYEEAARAAAELIAAPGAS